MEKLSADPNDPQQLVIRKSPAIAILGMIFRQLGLIGAGFTTIFSLLSAHDIKGLFDYIGSSEFFVVVGLIITVAIAAYGWMREIWSRQIKVFLASLLPDRIVTLKEDLKK